MVRASWTSRSRTGQRSPQFMQLVCCVVTTCNRSTPYYCKFAKNVTEELLKVDSTSQKALNPG